MKSDQKTWIEKRKYTAEVLELARKVLEEVREGSKVADAVRRYPLPEGGHLGKHVLISVYRDLTGRGEWRFDPSFLARIRMKPVRTLSGVTTITVLTKPYPCPGECIFCPTDVRMPKSYLPDEPGAMRALQHHFDPYDQVSARIDALQAVGHPTDKIELLILGGCWSSYERDYQQWFVKRSLDALNLSYSNSIEEAQLRNENAPHRNVGMVVEIRPDQVDINELAWMRYLGVTKVQLGAQSFDDEILARNKRGHNVQQTKRGVELLRAAGFKIVLHWMPNLLGATINSDREDFPKMWEGTCPDEIKIYPTQLLANAALYDYWLRGEYKPYTTDELVQLLADIKVTIPRYCRVNRVVRDIPSTHIIEGNKRSSLRQDVKIEMKRRGTKCQCVRCREVRGQSIDVFSLEMDDLVYEASAAQEHFLSFVTKEDKLAGFLRLSLPGAGSPETGLADLHGAAIIREVHVYGQSLPLGTEANGAAQHRRLGSRLLERAEEIAKQSGYRRLAVISAIGTRAYYAARGFRRGVCYMVKKLDG